MRRVKIIKVYLVLWLFLLHVFYFNYEVLSVYFMATVVFSASVSLIFVIGSLYLLHCGYKLTMIGGTFGAYFYKKDKLDFYLKNMPRLLPSNITMLLQSRKNASELVFTADETQNITKWMEESFHAQKGYISFFVNTSMMIGLLGTFTGLVQSVDSMGEIVLSLDMNTPLSEIMSQFAGPLSGMAIGFGSSLFGVISAIILGIEAYVLFRYQDNLIEDVDDQLKVYTVESRGGGGGGGGGDIISGSYLEGRRSQMDVFVEHLDLFTMQVNNLTGMTSAMKEMNETFLNLAGRIDDEQNLTQHRIKMQEEQLRAIADLTMRMVEDGFEPLIVNMREIQDDLKTSNKSILSSQNSIQKQMDDIAGVIHHSSTTMGAIEENLNNHFRAMGESTQSLNQSNQNLHNALDGFSSALKGTSEQYDRHMVLQAEQNSDIKERFAMIAESNSESISQRDRLHDEDIQQRSAQKEVFQELAIQISRQVESQQESNHSIIEALGKVSSVSEQSLHSQIEQAKALQESLNAMTSEMKKQQKSLETLFKASEDPGLFDRIFSGKKGE